MLPKPPTDKRQKWKIFWIGLAVRLAGLALIWLGNGSDSLWRKAVVVVGVVLTVGGIAVLRFLLLAEPLSRLTRPREEAAAKKP
jgi:hypothetical protein